MTKSQDELKEVRGRKDSVDDDPAVHVPISESTSRQLSMLLVTYCNAQKVSADDFKRLSSEENLPVIDSSVALELLEKGEGIVGLDKDTLASLKERCLQSIHDNDSDSTKGNDLKDLTVDKPDFSLSNSPFFTISFPTGEAEKTEKSLLEVGIPKREQKQPKNPKKRMIVEMDRLKGTHELQTLNTNHRSKSAPKELSMGGSTSRPSYVSEALVRKRETSPLPAFETDGSVACSNKKVRRRRSNEDDSPPPTGTSPPFNDHVEASEATQHVPDQAIAEHLTGSPSLSRDSNKESPISILKPIGSSEDTRASSPNELRGEPAAPLPPGTATKR
jgi:hypothetical protein